MEIIGLSTTIPKSRECVRPVWRGFTVTLYAILEELGKEREC